MRALILAPFDPAVLAHLRDRVEVLHESWLDTGRLYDPEQLGDRLQDEGVDVLVVEADFVFEPAFERAPCLRLVAVCRNALNHVDIDAATAAGVAVVHTPGRNANAVAELAMGAMFALARRLPQAGAYVAGGAWRDPAAGYRELRGREVAGSVVGVVGFGQIGRAVAAKCMALGARVVASDPFVPADEIEAAGAVPVSLHEVAGTSDFITLHVPDGPATSRLIDRRFLAATKDSAFLVNTGAGGAIDYDALIEALRCGRLAGAALDVFEGQPLPQSSPLLTAPNLLLTPHIGGATAETIARHSAMVAGDIQRFLAGEPLRHLVNPGYQLARAR
jgi:D-3-phosphoglycerate dehydrogenase